jgi:hypothetical protein
MFRSSVFNKRELLIYKKAPSISSGAETASRDFDFSALTVSYLPGLLLELDHRQRRAL